MPSDLVLYLVRLLVDEPGAVRIEEQEDEDGSLRLRLYVAEGDRGKVIGRGGRMAQALRTLARAAGARQERRVLLEIAE
ncbi:MAG: RNA-binding protein [Thermoleophilia bacterium]